MYYLAERVSLHNYDLATYNFVCSAFDISEIVEKLKKQVLNGHPAKNFKIIKVVEFDFKCAVQIKESDDEKSNKTL